MNCLTCGALLSLKIESISKDKRIVFSFCLAMALLGENNFVEKWVFSDKYVCPSRAQLNTYYNYVMRFRNKFKFDIY